MSSIEADRTHSLVFACFAVWLLVLMTGAYLWLIANETTASVAYSDMESLRSDVTVRLWIRRIHWFAAIPGVLLPLAVAASSLTAGQRKKSLLALAAATVFGAGWLTGRWLPWNQMALWGMTAGEGGYSPGFADNKTFVLLDRMVTSRQLAVAFHAHTKLLPVLAVGIGIAMALGARHDDTDRGTSSRDHRRPNPELPTS